MHEVHACGVVAAMERDLREQGLVRRAERGEWRPRAPRRSLQLRLRLGRGPRAVGAPVGEGIHQYST